MCTGDLPVCTPVPHVYTILLRTKGIRSTGTKAHITVTTKE